MLTVANMIIVYDIIMYGCNNIMDMLKIRRVKDVNVNQNTAYNTLSAEFYDLDPTYPPDQEVAFLSSFIDNSVPGPWLEAMSGSGRILIPLLQKGFEVEGVDNSPYMIARCKDRMKKSNVQTAIYNQSVTALTLPKKYSGIIICFASFQLLPNRAMALQALHSLKEHLLPGGMILIDIFIPWQSIKRCIVENTLLARMHIENTPMQSVRASEGAWIERRATIDVFPQEQMLVVFNDYTKHDHSGVVVATEREEMTYLWYHRYEMTYLLEKAGFSTVHIIDQNQEIVTYQALV